MGPDMINLVILCIHVEKVIIPSHATKCKCKVWE